MNDHIDTFRTLRGRWRLIAATMIVAALAGFVMTNLTNGGRGGAGYRATAIIVPVVTEARASSEKVNLDVIGLQVTGAEIQQRAAKTLGLSSVPVGLSSTVTVEANDRAGALQITSTSKDPERAAAVANAFAQGLVDELTAKAQSAHQREVASSQARLKQLQAEIAVLNKQIPAGDVRNLSAVDVRRTQRDAKAREYTQTFQKLQDLLSEGAASPGITIAQRAQSLPVAQRQLVGPSSKRARLGIAAVVGLLLGMGIALLLERMDVRVRTRKQAEAAFGLPVLADIPILPRRRRKEVVVSSTPRSEASAAFRLVRAALTNTTLSKQNGSTSQAPSSSFRPWRGQTAPRPPRGKAILVTSPGDRAGKSLVAANTAAVFAEAGLGSIAISADLRRPTLHEFMAVPIEPGLIQMIQAGNGLRGGSIHVTAVTRLFALPSGGVADNPGELLGSRSAVAALKFVQGSYDVAVLDTSSLLEASDATPLLEHIDTVLIVARAGHTTVEGARRTGEFLQRMGVSVAGVVLIGIRRLPLGERMMNGKQTARLVLGRLRPRRRSAQPSPKGRNEHGLTAPAAKSVDLSEGESAEPSANDEMTRDAQATVTSVARPDGAPAVSEG